MLNIIMLSVTNSNFYAERRCAERCYAERRYAERRYAECHYAERRYAECHDALTKALSSLNIKKFVYYF